MQRFYWLLCVMVVCSLDAAGDIKDYGTLKQEYKKLENTGADIEDYLNLFTKRADAKALREMMLLEGDFYSSIFEPLVQKLIQKNRIAQLNGITEKVEPSSSTAMFWAKSLNNVFEKKFGEYKWLATSEKWQLARPFLRSKFGNQVLREWLKLDRTLPFLQGEYEASKLSLMHYMLIEYSIQRALKKMNSSYDDVIDKDLVKDFLFAWKYGDRLEFEDKAILNYPEPDMGWAGAQTDHPTQGIFKGEYTVEQLVNALKLSKLMDEITIKDYAQLANELKKLNSPKDRAVLLMHIDKDFWSTIISSDEFYTNIFLDLIINEALHEGQIVVLIINIRNGLDDNDSRGRFLDRIAYTLHSVYRIEKYKDKKFAMAVALSDTNTGHKVLQKWLKLDKKLPFAQGTIVELFDGDKHVVGTLNVMQNMLMGYYLAILSRKHKIVFVMSEVDKTTLEDFVSAWREGTKEEKNYIGMLEDNSIYNGMRIDQQILDSGQWISKGKFTVPELARAMKLGYLFEDPIDLFAHACKEIFSK